MRARAQELPSLGEPTGMGTSQFSIRYAVIPFTVPVFYERERKKQGTEQISLCKVC